MDCLTQNDVEMLTYLQARTRLDFLQAQKTIERRATDFLEKINARLR